VRVLVLASFLALLAGCRLDAQVGVVVDDDGSGTVTVAVELDPQAAAELGDPAAVVTADLEQAGWVVEDPAGDGGGEGGEQGGAVRFVVRRSFGSPEDLPAVLDEVGGRDGVFRDVSLTVEGGVDRTTYRFGARVVLSGRPEQFSDPELDAALGNLPLGRTPEELAVLGADDPAAATLRLEVRLPGGEPDTDGEVRDGAATWSFPLTGGEPTDQEVGSVSEVLDGRTRALLGAGVLCAALAVVAVVVGLVRRRSSRSRSAGGPQPAGSPPSTGPAGTVPPGP
jgi:hypothetical protein